MASMALKVVPGIQYSFALISGTTYVHIFSEWDPPPFSIIVYSLTSVVKNLSQTLHPKSISVATQFLKGTVSQNFLYLVFHQETSTDLDGNVLEKI
jgi:hypothetical protein